jgi:hypothetical protein
MAVTVDVSRFRTTTERQEQAYFAMKRDLKMEVKMHSVTVATGSCITDVAHGRRQTFERLWKPPSALHYEHSAISPAAVLSHGMPTATLIMSVCWMVPVLMEQALSGKGVRYSMRIVVSCKVLWVIGLRLFVQRRQ